jgi:diguanylate cyclase (GGDEF)-like protein/PAS domain S-box-containing protein
MQTASSTRPSSHPASPGRRAVSVAADLEPGPHAAFLREAPAFAVWLIIFLYAAVGRRHAGLEGWGWIGTASAIALLRVLIAMRGLDAPRKGPAVASIGILYLLAHIAQALLWLLLLAPGTGPPSFAVRTATSLAAAMLLSAVCLRGWRSGWLVALAGWSVALIATAAGLWSAMNWASIGLLLWLPAAAVAGLAPRASPAPALRTAPGLSTGRQAGSTRRGVQLAIHTAAAPMIGIHDGRIFDMNRAAETFLGRAAARCLGRPASELLRVDPPSALDASFPSEERFAMVSADPVDAQATAVEPALARIRVGRSGDQSAIAVMSLNPPQDVDDDRELGNDARRLAAWLGAEDSEVWYRDEAGHLFLPASFDPRRALETDPEPNAFPLAARVPADDRAYVNMLYREQLAAGQTFDERITLLDAKDAPHSVRVVCLTRAGDAARGGEVIGVISLSSSGARSPVTRSDLLSELPVLIWLIDAAGRFVHAHSTNVQRWGLRIEPRLRPTWASTLALQPGSQDVFAVAVQHALDGKPTFDLLNYRTGPSGGRLALRSHFVPFHSPAGDGKTRRAVMIMDTIASVRELLDVERLRLSKAQYKDLVEASPNLIWACDEAFRFTFLSRRASRDVYGHAVEDLLGAPIGALLDPGADQTIARQALVGLRNGRALRDVEMSHITKDKQQITVAVSAVALKSPDGNFAGAIGISVDITTLKQREARLAEALRVERSVLDSTGQAIAVVKAGVVARCNDAFLQLLQMPAQDLAAAPVADLFADRNHWTEVATSAERAASSDGSVTREIRVRRTGPAGTPEQFLWCQITLRAIGEGEYVVALADIDQIRRREAHAQHDARHDELTGLPNRRLLSERVRAALATSALRNSGCAILVFDLDGFKPINDRYGHATGDVVLREISRRLQNIVRPQDTVARIGGDEFALLMPDCGEVQDVERIARRILKEVALPLASADVGGASLTASLGVVMAPEHGRDPEWLMRLADRAMYDAKIDGGNRVMFSGSAASRDVFTDSGARRA